MATQTNLPFSWDEVDRISDFNRLQLVLDALPDGDIIRALGAMRGNGRNEYPGVGDVEGSDCRHSLPAQLHLFTHTGA